MMGWKRHQLGHMQIVCTSLQTDKHASTLPLLSVFTGQMPFQARCPSCRPTNSVFPVNLAQIRSAVPEIYDSQTNKKQSQRQ